MNRKIVKRGLVQLRVKQRGGTLLRKKVNSTTSALNHSQKIESKIPEACLRGAVCASNVRARLEDSSTRGIDATI